jgi:hypothetical protein
LSASHDAKLAFKRTLACLLLFPGLLTPDAGWLAHLRYPAPRLRLW